MTREYKRSNASRASPLLQGCRCSAVHHSVPSAMANASAKRTGTSPSPPQPTICPTDQPSHPHSATKRRHDQESPTGPARLVCTLAVPPPFLPPRRPPPDDARVLGVRALTRPLHIPLALPRAHRLSAARPDHQRAHLCGGGPLPPWRRRMVLRRRVHHLGMPGRQRRVWDMGLVVVPHRESSLPAAARTRESSCLSWPGLLLLQIPLYAVFKLWSGVISPFFLGRSGGSSAPAEGEADAGKETLSKRQEKLRKRSERGDPRVRAQTRN